MIPQAPTQSQPYQAPQAPMGAPVQQVAAAPVQQSPMPTAQVQALEAAYQAPAQVFLPQPTAPMVPQQQAPYPMAAAPSWAPTGMQIPMQVPNGLQQQAGYGQTIGQQVFPQIPQYETQAGIPSRQRNETDPAGIEDLREAYSQYGQHAIEAAAYHQNQQGLAFEAQLKHNFAPAASVMGKYLVAVGANPDQMKLSNMAKMADAVIQRAIAMEKLLRDPKALAAHYLKIHNQALQAQGLTEEQWRAQQIQAQQGQPQQQPQPQQFVQNGQPQQQLRQPMPQVGAAGGPMPTLQNIADIPNIQRSEFIRQNVGQGTTVTFGGQRMF